MKIEEILYNKKGKVTCNDRSVSYNEIYSNAINLSKRVENHSSDIKIAIYMKNSIEFIESFFAIHMINGIPVFFSTYIKCEELCQECDEMGISLILTDNENKKKFANKNEIRQKICVVDIENHKQSTLVSKSNYKSNEIIAIIRTSGTGGKTKYAMLTKKGVIGNIKANIKAIGLNENDRTLVVLPMCFGYCFSSQWLTHLYLGGDIVITNGFNYYEIENLIEKNKITTILLVPSILNTLSKISDRISVSKYKTLKKIVFGGMFANEIALNKINIMLENAQLIQTYGMTELSPRVSSKMFPIKGNIDKANNVGRCIEGVKVMIDSKDNNEIGEILVKSNYFMKQYYNEKMSLENGWFRTGDMGYIDENGELFLCGRKKNIIIVNGINIIPEVIENVIIECDGIQNVLVFGKKNEMLEENIVVLIEYKGNSDKQSVIKEINNLISKKLPSYMYPQKIEFVDKIEKTYTGKVKRNGN